MLAAAFHFYLLTETFQPVNRRTASPTLQHPSIINSASVVCPWTQVLLMCSGCVFFVFE